MAWSSALRRQVPGSVAVSQSQMWSNGSLATTETPDHTVASGPVNTSCKAAGLTFWSVYQRGATLSVMVRAKASRAHLDCRVDLVDAGHH